MLQCGKCGVLLPELEEKPINGCHTCPQCGAVFEQLSWVEYWHIAITRRSTKDSAGGFDPEVSPDGCSYVDCLF